VQINQKSKNEKSTRNLYINKDSLAAKPKVLSENNQICGEDGSTRIMSADGKTVKYEGRNQSQSTKDALINSKDEVHQYK
jgi:hypothetical protein